ncbi:MAG: type II toxin-antitoxin system VapC family toxin [Deltaproteobacteria bacterium]|nr:type II toxin-antitoxin system VapC family toxin [Deltaproteobacteria bacterium]
MAFAALDTHTLLWFTLDTQHLSARALDACHQMEEMGGLVCSISLWELGIKIKRGALTLPLDLPSYIQRLQRLDWLEIISVDVELWLANLALPWEHRDPVNRTIVAMAQLYNLPLVSKDQMIASFYAKTIW